MKKSSWGKYARDIIAIFVGCVLIGASFNAFFDRFSLAPGGTFGAVCCDKISYQLGSMDIQLTIQYTTLHIGIQIARKGKVP